MSKRGRDESEPEEYIEGLEPASKKLKMDNSVPQEENNSQIPIFVVSLRGKTETMYVDKECTVENMIRILSEKTGMEVNMIRLLYAGKQLVTRANNAVDGQIMYLSDYNIQKESTIHLVSRLRGGKFVKFKATIQSSNVSYELEMEDGLNVLEMKRSLNKKMSNSSGVNGLNLKWKGTPLENPYTLEHYGITDGSDVIIEKRLNVNRMGNLKLSSEEDMFDCEGERIEMSCGHAVTVDGLTSYCKSIYSEKVMFVMTCPHIDRKNKNISDPDRYCRKIWKWDEVRKAAHLTPEEIKFFEEKANQNAMKAEGNVYLICPKCKTCCFREDTNAKRVICSVCKHDFCFNCLKEWKGSGYTNCISYECSLEGTAKNLKVLEGEKIRVKYVEIMTYLYRSCVWCGSLIEYLSDCKHMSCYGCKKSFCFVCLKKRLDDGTGFQCGSIDKVCPVAPIQTVEDLKKIQKEWEESQKKDEDNEDDE